MGHLTIHVFGRGFGESIVIQLPNGRIGLIDCFSPQLSVAESVSPVSVNPVLDFIVNELKAESLAFVGLTHPHEDHGRGLSHVLDYFSGRIDEIWIFYAFQSLSLQRYLEAIVKTGHRLPIESFLDDPPGTYARELARIRNYVLDQCDLKQKSPSLLRIFLDYDEFEVPEEPVRFHFLGPQQNVAVAYEGRLIDGIGGFVGAGDSDEQNWHPYQVNHNLVSPVILLEFGETRVVLGGDVERDGWTWVLSQIGDVRLKRPKLRCDLVKISHHGSTNGFVDNLYEHHFGAKQKPLAVLTPFNRHKKPLPTRDGLNHLRGVVSELLVTSLVDVYRSTTLPASETPKTALAVPAKWIEGIHRNPEWLGALNPAVIWGTVFPPRSGSVPLEWIPDLITEPGLVSCIHPDLVAHASKTATDYDSHRVTVVFDEFGEEVKGMRHVGSAAGRVT